jgi:predicted RNA-binding protein with TRAM domain
MKKSQRNAKNRRGRYVRKCPVEIGSEYTVNIIDKTPNGAGIAKIKGFLVLVNGTKIGDHIQVKITQTDSLSAEAEIIA